MMKRMKKKQRNALVRKLIVLIQLITLLGFTAFVFLNELLPIKYLAVISGGLFGMWLICFGMQSLKSKKARKVRIVSVIHLFFNVKILKTHEKACILNHAGFEY